MPQSRWDVKLAITKPHPRSLLSYLTKLSRNKMFMNSPAKASDQREHLFRNACRGYTKKLRSLVQINTLFSTSSERIPTTLNFCRRSTPIGLLRVWPPALPAHPIGTPPYPSFPISKSQACYSFTSSIITIRSSIHLISQ